MSSNTKNATSPKYRGVFQNDNFLKDFKESDFYNKLYSEHNDELLIGVRYDSLNIYYQCDSIAKIKCCACGQTFNALINNYYLNNGQTNYSSVPANVIIGNYDTIKKQSISRSTDEKKSQHSLVLSNNSNSDSEWYCFDVEYVKRYPNQQMKQNNFAGRFDIIAINKNTFEIAFIELKYGSKAIGGESGIRKHVEDFYQFNGTCTNGVAYFEDFKSEAVSLLSALELLDKNFPVCLKGITIGKINSTPLFYVITLNNNPDASGTTPKMTMSGYLFDDKRWGCNRISSLVKNGTYYDLTKHDKNFKVTFLFSKAQLPTLDIKNILDLKNYEVEVP